MDDQFLDSDKFGDFGGVLDLVVFGPVFESERLEGLFFGEREIEVFFVYEEVGCGGSERGVGGDDLDAADFYFFGEASGG